MFPLTCSLSFCSLTRVRVLTPMVFVLCSWVVLSWVGWEVLADILCVRGETSSLSLPRPRPTSDWSCESSPSPGTSPCLRVHSSCPGADYPSLSSLVPLLHALPSFRAVVTCDS